MGRRCLETSSAEDDCCFPFSSSPDSVTFSCGASGGVLTGLSRGPAAAAAAAVERRTLFSGTLFSAESTAFFRSGVRLLGAAFDDGVILEEGGVLLLHPTSGRLLFTAIFSNTVAAVCTSISIAMSIPPDSFPLCLHPNTMCCCGFS